MRPREIGGLEGRPGELEGELKLVNNKESMIVFLMVGLGNLWR